LETAQEDANLLTVRQVAERLQVSLWTAYRKVESGEIPAVKLGTGKRSPIRVDADELERWLYKEQES
jgi:excisionase family DNA binding protein